MTNMNVFSPRRNSGCTLRIFPRSWTALAASSVGCGGSCRWGLSAVPGSSGSLDTNQLRAYLCDSNLKSGITQERGGGAEWNPFALVEGGLNAAVHGSFLIPAQTQGLGTALKILFSEKLIEKIPESGPSYGFQLTRQEIVALFNAFGRWVWDFPLWFCISCCVRGSFSSNFSQVSAVLVGMLALVTVWYQVLVWSTTVGMISNILYISVRNSRKHLC